MNQRYCQQCKRRLYPSEGEMCNLCIEYWEMTLAAHEALYGREEREMEEERIERYESLKDEPDYEPFPMDL